MMSSCKILYEDWEMECCGEPFQILDRVSWIVSKAPVTESFDYYYDEHGIHPISYNLTGCVQSIQAIYSEVIYTKERERQKGAFILIPIEKADGKHPDVEGREWTGYIVTLVDVKVNDYPPL